MAACYLCVSTTHVNGVSDIACLNFQLYVFVFVWYADGLLAERDVLARRVHVAVSSIIVVICM